jgi:hypothetical protein
MSERICQCQYHPSALQRPEPIADAFASRWINAVSPPTNHRTMWRIHSGAGHPNELALGFIRPIAASNSNATLQIPIAT